MNALLVDGLPPQLVRSPEGIELHFQTAAATERLVALVIDLGIVLLLFVIGIALAPIAGLGPVLLWLFVLRHGYFLWSETRGRGTTFGKRRFHLRVIRADGGPLTTEILLARNLTREVELFLPLIVLLVPDVLFAEHQGVVRAVAGLWVLGLLFFPLCNAQRLRIGDLLAGTRVVLSPPVRLARDLADARTPVRATAATTTASPPEFAFSAAQLAIYGEHELAVLEDVLRKARSEGGERTLEEVAKAIGRRIAWPDLPALAGRHARFLQAFYTAQRQHLEQQLLLGRRRLQKHGKRRT
ncbi:MAG: RDD family protein [Planctomycetota bacterium]